MKNIITSIILAVGVPAYSGIIPQVSPKSFNVDYYTGTSMMFGHGYDSFKDDSSGKCVIVPATEYDETRTSNTIQESTFKLELIESKYDLAKRLGITATASLKSGFSKGSATVNYLNEQSLNQYSIYILVSAEILTPLERAKDEQFDSDYIDLARSNPKAFRTKCGNEYVAAIQRGGVFYGLLKLNTEDAASYTRTKASLRAKVGTFKAAVDLEQSISEATSHKSLQIFAFQIGGESLPYPTNVTELINRVKNFPAEVANRPVPIRSITAPYAQLKTFPIEASVFDTATQESVLDYLSQLRFKVTDHRNNVEFILNNKSQFQSFSQEELNKRIDYANEKINKINFLTKNCLNNFDKCQYPDDFQYQDILLPERLVKSIADQQCKLRTREECGYIYKVIADNACDVLNYNLGKGKVCGTQESAIPVTCSKPIYKESSGAACGVKLYNQKTSLECGSEPRGECTRSMPIQILSFLGINDNEPHRGSSCFDAPKTCRLEKFGVESYHTCRDQSFGIEVPSACSQPTLEYKECRDPQFGVESYMACASPKHPIEGTRQCYLLETVDSETGILKYEACKM